LRGGSERHYNSGGGGSETILLVTGIALYLIRYLTESQPLKVSNTVGPGKGPLVIPFPDR
jgi:hypothetical protein